MGAGERRENTWRGVRDNEKVRVNASYLLLGLKDLKIWLVRIRRTWIDRDDKNYRVQRGRELLVRTRAGPWKRAA